MQVHEDVNEERDLRRMNRGVWIEDEMKSDADSIISEAVEDNSFQENGEVEEDG